MTQPLTPLHPPSRPPLGPPPVGGPPLIRPSTVTAGAPNTQSLLHSAANQEGEKQFALFCWIWIWQLCPIPAGVQGQAVWSPAQLGLVSWWQRAQLSFGSTLDFKVFISSGICVTISELLMVCKQYWTKCKSEGSLMFPCAISGKSSQGTWYLNSKSLCELQPTRRAFLWWEWEVLWHFPAY